MTLCAPRVHTKYKVLCEHNARNYKSNSEFEFYICINLISQRLIDESVNIIEIIRDLIFYSVDNVFYNFFRMIPNVLLKFF